MEIEESHQLRVLGVDPDQGRVAYAMELPFRPNSRQLQHFKRSAKDRFYDRYPNGQITSIKRVAMGPREKRTS